ncbi:transglutaminase-like cysteine peptidase [Zavarzinia compransoris]|uniref:Transglutaminase n=1 Tax=Zavarzinia compransoris TaxID=1264899 RepID=A0A317E5S7_9PROT|nr:transglutaminase-like cysteine peptidase [Zavarzinia compransoris]PWR21550.1 hypothetical protein DKG75_05965 [Zavarzinia compransoris]TDP45681.1 putative transglutaminase-like cysteine proteinase [Zavarzinia compransoris]
MFSPLRTAILLLLQASCILMATVAVARADEVLVEGPIAAAPEGFAAACFEMPELCDIPSPTAITGKPIDFTVADDVNYTVNRQTRYVSDQVKFGQEDYWSPSNGSGDCEDIALAKMKLMISKGYDRSAMRLALVYGLKSGTHAVLVVTIENTDYVLDNMTNKMVTWDASGYSFTAIQSRANPLVWVNVDIVKSFAAMRRPNFANAS